MYDNLYSEFSNTELQRMYSLRCNIAQIRLPALRDGTYISANTFDWLGIFEPYMTKHNKHIYLHKIQKYYKTEDLENYYPFNQGRGLNEPFNITPNDDYGIIFVDTSTNAKIYEYADKIAKDPNVAWQHLVHIDRLLLQHQKHKIRVLKSENLILVLSSDINDKLVAETLAIIPNLFDIAELKADTNIMNCCKAVIENKSIKPYLEELFKKLADAQNEKFKTVLMNSFTASKRSRLQALTNNIQSKRNDIKNYEDHICQYQEQIQNWLNEKLGIESTLNNNPEAFNNLINCLNTSPIVKSSTTKRYNIGYGTNDLLLFELEAPITLYETEPLERQYKNLECQISSTKKKYLKVLSEIFLKEEYQLYCTTWIGIDLTAPAFEAKYEYIGIDFSEYKKMPQPHLSFYNCWGDQSYNIKKALKENDILTALQLMFISIRNINFTDTAVLTRWLDKLAYNTTLTSSKCIKDSQDNWYSFDELYAKINKKAEEAMMNAAILTGPQGVAQPELIDELEGEE